MDKKKHYYEKMFEYENENSLYEDKFYTEDEWLEHLSPNIYEAYHEYTFDQDNQEDY